MPEVTPHDINAERLKEALEDIRRRTFGRWHWMQYGGLSMGPLYEMRDELLDHAAAAIAAGAAPDGQLRNVLHTAAECSLGLLSWGCFPGGDQELLFPLIDETLSTEDKDFDAVASEAPTARSWVDAFELALVSGRVWDHRLVIGLLLREDYAPAIRDGVPYSRFESASLVTDLAQMDALSRYLTPSGHLGNRRPTVPLCLPTTEERAAAAQGLDAAGTLTPDQRLLRVLLDDDRAAFEKALVARLLEHRQTVGDDPASRTLLPLGALAATALAVQAHGWTLDVHSRYLPQGLVGVPDALDRAAAGSGHDLGHWGVL
ncbi:immunity 49 family protein [Streptomyces sp. NPDC059985]|uniref:immunity 49 family protein n=1 Tax=Streptomyces sp. NPDC059985 TaxID=3347025 RepID=UPI0036A883A9